MHRTNPQDFKTLLDVDDQLEGEAVQGDGCVFTGQQEQGRMLLLLRQRLPRLLRPQSVSLS